MRRRTIIALHQAGAGCAARIVRIRRSKPMLDLILLAVGLGFFVLSVAYAYACERL